MLKGEDPLDRVVEVANWCKEHVEFSVFVTNEVGLSLVPASSIARKFVDVMGRVNKALSELSDRFVFVVSGVPVDL